MPVAGGQAERVRGYCWQSGEKGLSAGWVRMSSAWPSPGKSPHEARGEDGPECAWSRARGRFRPN